MVQAREARDQEQEEACAAAVWVRAAAQEPEEVWGPVVAVWAGWAEHAQEQDPADSVSVHHAALQRHIASAFPVTRRNVQDVELPWREGKVERSERIAGLSVFVNIILLAIKYTFAVLSGR